jgi:hypothetical protein
MKPVLQTDRNITSTLEGERIEMAFDANSLAHLQNLYINIYQDREMAVLREYSCNAYDAHVDAGIKDPIEITLPSRFNPVLTIQDHGIGMSLDTLRDTYSKYGASTKRDSDDVIGSFGIGCKSALTYTDQFTVTACKDGREVIVSVSRNAQGIGELTIAHEGATDRGNGVTITIPTPGYTTFAEKAQKLFQYWPEGSVLVDDKEPARFDVSDDIKHLIGDIYIHSTENYYYGNEKSVVVMGNVAYPVETADLGLDFNANGRNTRYHRIIAFLPIGAVEPIPAREGLTTTAANEKALLAIGEEIKANIGTLIQAEIDRADDMLGAIMVVHEVRRHYPAVFLPKTWNYQGDDIPTHVEAAVEISTTELDQYGQPLKHSGGFVLVKRGDEGKRHNRVKKLSWDELINPIYFTGFDLDQFTGNHRRRLDQWLENNYEAEPIAWKAQLYILTEKLPEDQTLIAQDRIYDWEDVRNTKLPSTCREGGGGLQGAYESIESRTGLNRNQGYTVVQAKDIDVTKPIFFFSPETDDIMREESRRLKYTSVATLRAERMYPYAEVIVGEHSDAQFFCFPPNRRAKFERTFPSAVEVRDECRRMATVWAKGLTKRQRTQLAINHQGTLRDYRRLSTIKDKLVDPDLREHVQMSSGDISGLTNSFATFRKRVVNFEDGILKLNEITNIMDRYPLLRGGYYSADEMNHVGLYLNSAYNHFHKPTTTTTGV